jgi:hypothetical protein
MADQETYFRRWLAACADLTPADVTLAWAAFLCGWEAAEDGKGAAASARENLLANALALSRSMILSGESMSPQARELIDGALRTHREGAVERKTRVVTPRQFAEGYRRARWIGSAADAQDGGLWHRWRETRHPFVKIRDLPDGDVLVEEPSTEPA